MDARTPSERVKQTIEEMKRLQEENEQLKDKLLKMQGENLLLQSAQRKIGTLERKVKRLESDNLCLIGLVKDRPDINVMTDNLLLQKRVNELEKTVGAEYKIVTEAIKHDSKKDLDATCYKPMRQETIFDTVSLGSSPFFLLAPEPDDKPSAQPDHPLPLKKRFRSE